MGNLVVGVFSVVFALVMLGVTRVTEWWHAAAGPVRHRPHARMAGR